MGDLKKHTEVHYNRSYQKDTPLSRHRGKTNINEDDAYVNSGKGSRKDHNFHQHNMAVTLLSTDRRIHLFYFVLCYLAFPELSTESQNVRGWKGPLWVI